MTSRVLLVALVAVLGLDLPGADELASWRRAGREWTSARLAGLSSPRDVESLAGSKAGAATNRGDLAFEAAVETMAAGFSADLASIESRAIPAIAVAVAEIPLAHDPRGEPLATAVRLTREAVDAWASLIRPAVATSDPGEIGESF